MLKVIFDSSFLMAVVENPTTWFEDITDGIGKFDPILLECVGDELRKLSSRQDRKSRLARVAIDLAAGFTSMPCGTAAVDDELVSAALSEKAFVATVDSELQQSLKSAHVKVISLKKGRVSVP